MATTDCLYSINPMGGGVGSHNGRCSLGLESPDIHLRASHHVRDGVWCGRVCNQCATAQNKLKGVIVRELTAEELS